MTFYYHFKDIYDLIEWSCEEDARKALEGKKTYDTWQQGLCRSSRPCRKNRAFILNVYRSISREQVENYLYKADLSAADRRRSRAGGGHVRPRGGSGLHRHRL